MAFKEILKGHEARLRIKKGLDLAADAVRPTLGPIGMMAVIEYPGLDAIECDDGVTILKNVEFSDHYMNIGAQRLRRGALRTFSEGGDATATTTVLSQALTNEAFKVIAADSSKIREVRDRLKTGLSDVIAQLQAHKLDVIESDIEKIAAVASLDQDAAVAIASIIKEVGVDGVVTVEKASTIGYSTEVVKGAKFDKGYISPFFVNNEEAGTVVLENAYIVLVDRKVSTNEQILPILNSIGTGKDILFIADDVDGLALASLTNNARLKIANIACVKNPFNGTRGKDFLFDMAALTGATVISEEMGMRLDQATVALAGYAEKVVVSKETTTIIGGKSSASLASRITLIQGKIAASTSEYEKTMLEDRIAALTGGIGVLRLGTYTDNEFYAKKYKLDNAINTTQSALQEGIIAGGGRALSAIKIEDPIFKVALIEPLKQMAINSGMDWIDVVTSLKESHEHTGYNFITKKKVDMFTEGIVDSFKLTRIALESAVDTACSMVSYETAIIIQDEKA